MTNSDSRPDNQTLPAEPNAPAVVKYDRRQAFEQDARCPTCNLGWWLNPPVKCHGENDAWRCIECKAIYTTPMLAAPDMLAALRSLVSNVLDYERVNNLSPNPGRNYCWDSVEHAIGVIANATGSQSSTERKA